MDSRHDVGYAALMGVQHVVLQRIVEPHVVSQQASVVGDGCVLERSAEAEE
jgi:hypothetical protein